MTEGFKRTNVALLDTPRIELKKVTTGGGRGQIKFKLIIIGNVG